MLQPRGIREPTISAADQYRSLGFLPQAQTLADTSVLPALLADEPMFVRALEVFRADGRNAVPYLKTDAIQRVAQDSAIVSAVEAILGTRDLIMWGANIRRGTPNQANEWHVDLESLLWTTVTVAIGLDGCVPLSATWCLPGTHRLRQGPPPLEEHFPSGSAPQQITGFGNGKFYVFDARVWHRGNPVTSHDRVVLFLHYQKASEARIPLMEDYVHQTFSASASPYFPMTSRGRVCTKVAKLPRWYRWQKLKSRLQA